MATGTLKYKSTGIKPLKSKRITVSSKRQITIPKEFYDALGIEKDVVMELVNNRLIIRPVKHQSDDFSEELLSDLIDEGYEGKELKEAFSKRRALLTSSVDRAVEDAKSQKVYDSLESLLNDTDDEGNEEK